MAQRNSRNYLHLSPWSSSSQAPSPVKTRSTLSASLHSQSEHRAIPESWKYVSAIIDLCSLFLLESSDFDSFCACCSYVITFQVIVCLMFDASTPRLHVITFRALSRCVYSCRHTTTLLLLLSAWAMCGARTNCTLKHSTDSLVCVR